MSLIFTGVKFTKEEKKVRHIPITTDDDSNDNDIDDRIKCDTEDDSTDSTDNDIDAFNNNCTWITRKKYVDGKPNTIKDQVVSDKDPNNIIVFQCLGKGGMMCKSNDIKQIIKIIRDKNNYYLCEMITRECKPYIDFDYKIDIKDATLKLKKNTLSLVIELIKGGMKELGHPITNDSIIKITESCGKVDCKYKISFHVTINMPIRFSNAVQAQQLVDKMQIYAAKSNRFDTIMPYIDRAVYTKDRNMRLIGHEKYEIDPNNRKAGFTIPTGRVFKAIDKILKYLEVPDCDLLDYLASHNDCKFVQMINDNKYESNRSVKQKINRSTLHEDCVVSEPNNQLDKDEFDKLMCIVRKKCSSVRFERYSNGYYDFDYERGKDPCPHGSFEHESISFYCWITNGIVYAKCRSTSCKDKKSIKLGSLNIKKLPRLNIIDNNEINNQINNENRCKLFEKCNVISVDEEYISMQTKKKTLELMTVGSTKYICVKSQCGTGKTKMIVYLLTEFITFFRSKYGRDPNILFISTRISYLNDLKNNTSNDVEDATGYNIHSYRDFEGEVKDHELQFMNKFEFLNGGSKTSMKFMNGLIISLESLHHICFEANTSRSSINIYDAVIMDESESIVQQIFSPYIKGDKVNAFNNFQDQILKHAKKVSLLDAGLSDASLVLINIDDHLKINKIMNDFNDSNEISNNANINDHVLISQILLRSSCRDIFELSEFMYAFLNKFFNDPVLKWALDNEPETTKLGPIEGIELKRF